MNTQGKGPLAQPTQQEPLLTALSWPLSLLASARPGEGLNGELQRTAQFADLWLCCALPHESKCEHVVCGFWRRAELQQNVGSHWKGPLGRAGSELPTVGRWHCQWTQGLLPGQPGHVSIDREGCVQRRRLQPCTCRECTCLLLSNSGSQRTDRRAA